MRHPIRVPLWLPILLLLSHPLDAQDVSLRPLFDQYGLTVRDQGGRGTCSVFAIAGLIEFEYAIAKGKSEHLSVEFLNWASNQITGIPEDGSFFSDALSGLRKYGICSDELLPYNPKGQNDSLIPDQAAFRDARKRKQAEIIWIKEWDPDCGMTEDQIQQVKAQLRRNHPVAIGFQWPKNEERYRKWIDGMMSVPPREGVFDGHSVIMVGYQDDASAPGGGWFLFRNSHGAGYGDQGYGRMPYEYLARYANDGVSVRVGKATGKAERISLAELDTTLMEKGPGTPENPIAKWLITLDGQALQIHAKLALDQPDNQADSVEYLILADQKILMKSGIQSGETEYPVNLRLNGVKKLGILVINRGSVPLPGRNLNSTGEIVFRGNTPFASANRVIREPEEILTPSSPATPRINSPGVYGTHPGSPFLYRIPATGARPIKFQAIGLPNGVSCDPDTGIISGTFDSAGEYVIILGAENQFGADRKTLTVKAGPTLALTPPMGWNSWYIYYSLVSDSIIRRAADHMISSGMADFGYQYVNIDDCWAVKANSNDPILGGPARNPDGSMKANGKFPDMKGLTDYIHTRGLKAGIYSSPAMRTCAGYTGSYQYEAKDLQTIADWGFDFLKYDWCSYGRLISERTTEACQKPYRLLWEESQKINRDIVLNLCQYGMAEVWKWGSQFGNCWRTTGDLGILEGSSMPPFYYIGLSNSEHYEYSRPGGWNDPDYILIGWFRNALKEEEFEKTDLSPNEQYAYMTMWSMMAAPLIYSGEMSLLDPFTLNVLCNHEVIQINQDILGRQARVIRKTKNSLVMMKELEDGSRAVAFFHVTGDANTRNPDLVDEEASGMAGVMDAPMDPADQFIWENQPRPTRMEISVKELGVETDWITRDVWRQKDTGAVGNILSAEVPYHGTALIRLIPPKR